MVKQPLSINVNAETYSARNPSSPNVRSPRAGDFPSRPNSARSSRNWETDSRASSFSRRSKSPKRERALSPARPIMGTGRYQGEILGYHSPRQSPTFAASTGTSFSESVGQKSASKLPIFASKTASLGARSPRARMPISPSNAKNKTQSVGASPRSRATLQPISPKHSPILSGDRVDLKSLPAMALPPNSANSEGKEESKEEVNTADLSFSEIMAKMSKTKENSFNRKRQMRQQQAEQARLTRTYQNVGKGAGHTTRFNATGSAGHVFNKEGKPSDVPWEVIKPDTDMTLIVNGKTTSAAMVNEVEYRRASCLYNTHSELNKAAGHAQPWHTPKSIDAMDAKLKGFGKPDPKLMSESGMKIIKANIESNMDKVQKDLERMQEEQKWGATQKEKELLTAVLKHQGNLSMSKEAVVETLQQKLKRNIKKVMAMGKAAKLQAMSKANRRGDTLSGIGTKFTLMDMAAAAQGKNLIVKLQSQADSDRQQAPIPASIPADSGGSANATSPTVPRVVAAVGA